MNKKVIVLAASFTALLILGGISSNVLYGTQYLSTKPGYEFSVSSQIDWWDCNWSYYTKITID
ncbi:MAG: hypothetical protein JW771_04140, partial [Candidatus Thermoplasmatota archaeon]|nr:hypothetical protein [Candidatus Thermoplasmatota archaeon]